MEKDKTVCGGDMNVGCRTFADMKGGNRAAKLLEDAFSIYGGREDDNTLSRLILTNAAGRKYFVNDNVWWKYTDVQCNFHATYGWRPFFDAAYRKVDRNTWQELFKYQVTPQMQDVLKKSAGALKVPPTDFLPFNYDPLTDDLSIARFYSNVPMDEETGKLKSPEEAAGYSENVDYPLMNCISATDYLLWERDVEMACLYLPKLDAFLDAVHKRFQDDSGLLWVGTEGSQIEYCHKGFRYPAHTHVYLLKVYRNMQEAARFAERIDLVDKYGQKASELEKKMALFIEDGKWFVGGLKDAAGQGRYGTGRLDDSASSYFDAWHNVNAVVLHIANEDLSRSIADKIASIPAMTANHLTLVNYPARPEEEIDFPNEGSIVPGQHMNAGWHWMLSAGALYTYTRTQQPDLLLQLEGLLSDHHNHYSIDYYNDYGADKHKQWPEHGRDSYSVTCAGAFGMFFRALLGLEMTADGMRVSPRLPRECESLTTIAPVYYAGKKVRFKANNGTGSIRQVHLNGKPYSLHDDNAVTLPYVELGLENMVEVERKD